MGIQGLLPLLKSIMVPIHIKDLEGCSVAIDTYSWLHKGALSCSRDLCKGLPTSRHIEYCMHRVNLLRHYGVNPILVFDGGPLPMKIEEENKRARTRKENLARAIDHELCGNSSAAYECYQKAVDISPSIAHGLIQVLKQQNVSFIVAPYEADAQMTFLALSNQVDAVITEDSDLIPFGCPRIIYKMDKFGQGHEFKYSMLSQNKEPSFAGFNRQMLLQMCILSGCDYLPSLSGMGPRRAHALIMKFKTYEKVIKHLRYSTLAVPPLYEESFKKAILTFQHQRVYDPMTENIVHLSYISDNIGDDLEFLGPAMPLHIAQGIAKGNLDPITQEPLEGQSVCMQMEVGINSDEKRSKPKSERKKLELPVQKNVLTKYFCFASPEVRRNFKAPRISPKNPSPITNDCFTPDGQLSMEDTSSEIDCSFSSSSDSENADNGSLKINVPSDGFSSAIPEISNSPCPTVLDEMRHLDDSPQPSAGQSDDQQYSMLNQNQEDRIASAVVGGGTRTGNGKVVVKSRFFQDKQVKKKDLENKQDNLYTKVDKACKSVDGCICNGSDHTSFEGTTVKRKASLIGRIQKENMKSKNSLTDTSHDNGDYEVNPVGASADVKDGEGKFGSNISHIDRYSNIAEKSLERFASVISSFSYSSSGSRASGLRAPLKDVSNSRTKRSSTCVDLDQFAYKPANKKARTPSRHS